MFKVKVCVAIDLIITEFELNEFSGAFFKVRKSVTIKNILHELGLNYSQTV